MVRFFVSYSRVDNENGAVEQFVMKIRRVRRSDEVWWDDELRGGDIWWQEIMQAIAECDVFIYLLSNESVSSSYCRAEYSEARRLRKPILTVQLRGRTDIPEELREIQYVDMTAGIKDGDALTSLYSALESMEQHIPKRRLRPLWNEPTPKPGVPSIREEKAAAPDAENIPLPDVPKARLIGEKEPTQPNLPRKVTAQSFPILPTIAVTAALTLIAMIAVPAIFNALSQATVTPTAATQVAGVPTAPPTASLTNTPVPLGYSLDNPVTTNDQWTSIEQDFDGITMVLVPAGCFTMGSEDGDEDESPTTDLCFDEPFWIDKYEVTQEQFARLGGVAAEDSAFSGNENPRDLITWFEARNYCTLREASLPTEAEWEYAARGPDDLIYPWGDDFEGDNVVYSENSNMQPAEVGSREGGASWVGALDMSGNVWEWVASAYEDYPYVPGDRREDINSDAALRVLRGGAWNDTYGDLRASNRIRLNPGDGFGLIGVRCARSF
jgi:formylglycine-generating enzyme required for sulfatase activity